MMEVAQQSEVIKGPNKRRLGYKKGSKGTKKPKVFQGSGEKVKIDRKMKKLFRKRARDYHSDDDDEVDELGPVVREEKRFAMNNKKVVEEKPFEEEEGEEDDVDEEEEEEEAEADNDGSDNEDDEILPGITKFSEGCRAFKMAFKKIIKKSVSEDSLGPVLSGHKKLVAEKLAEEESERKVKGEAKKDKHLIREKGRVKPANYLDLHEKFLIGVATKGVVKLFNAVNKAQIAQKGLNPSSFKDAKAIRKRRNEAFFSELNKPSSDASGKDHTSAGGVDDEGPAWAPLRDNYMLTNPKLKDWDKMQDTSIVEDDNERMSEDSYSDDD